MTFCIEHVCIFEKNTLINLNSSIRFFFQNESVTDIYIEIQTRHIEIYSAKFSVNAQFSGIRYVMFHWPVISAAIGMS